MNYEEAASFLSLKLNTLYSLVWRKQIPHVRLTGRLVRFSSEELLDWLKQKKVDATVK
jgi:excisionase family DNA binding protein